RLIPWSSAAWMAAIDCRSSAPPHIHPPLTHAPKPTAEISIPDDPSLRINITALSQDGLGHHGCAAPEPILMNTIVRRHVRTPFVGLPRLRSSRAGQPA